MAKFVTYATTTGQRIKARVVTRHRDGTITVEPWHEVGPWSGGLIGGRVRLAAGAWQPA